MRGSDVIVREVQRGANRRGVAQTLDLIFQRFVVGALWAEGWRGAIRGEQLSGNAAGFGGHGCWTGCANGRFGRLNRWMRDANARFGRQMV